MAAAIGAVPSTIKCFSKVSIYLVEKLIWKWAQKFFLPIITRIFFEIGHFCNTMWARAALFWRILHQNLLKIIGANHNFNSKIMKLWEPPKLLTALLAYIIIKFRCVFTNLILGTVEHDFRIIWCNLRNWTIKLMVTRWSDNCFHIYWNDFIHFVGAWVEHDKLITFGCLWIRIFQ